MGAPPAGRPPFCVLAVSLCRRLLRAAGRASAQDVRGRGRSWSTAAGGYRTWPRPPRTAPPGAPRAPLQYAPALGDRAHLLAVGRQQALFDAETHQLSDDGIAALHGFGKPQAQVE